MVKYLVHARDTRIHDVDYLYDDPEKFLKLLPYIKKKIDGDWRIAILEPDIKFVRKIADSAIVPEYVTLELYMEKSVAEKIAIEKPKIFVKQKTAYEKYLDSIGEMKVLINPKAAKELYRRVGTHKEKLTEYLITLSESVDGEISISDVTREVLDERKLYASDVLNSFLLRDRWRWKRYEDFVQVMGRDYAYYSLRKYANKLLEEKNRYLRNEDTKLRIIKDVDSLSVCLAYTLFNTTKSVELDLCMRMLDNRDLARRVL